MMRRVVIFSLPWLFVFAAAVFDCWFAWHYRGVLAAWELNPLARWSVATAGLYGVFAFKFLGLVFAMAVAWHCGLRRRWLGSALTAVVAGAYLLLLVHYAVGYAQPPAYEVAARDGQTIELRAALCGFGTLPSNDAGFARTASRSFHRTPRPSPVYVSAHGMERIPTSGAARVQNVIRGHPERMS
jgi:hypothetical protein